MRLLPWTKIKLWTSLPPDEASLRLQRMIGESGWWVLDASKPFHGTFDGVRFKVLRTLGTLFGLRYHNAFQPVIVGEVLPESGGAAVLVRMRLQVFAAAFMAAWLGALVAFAGVIAYHAWRFGPVPVASGSRQVSTAAGLLLLAGMFTFGYLLLSVSFWLEVGKARVQLWEGLGCGGTPGAEHQMTDSRSLRRW